MATQRKRITTPPRTASIDLALQGGGSHGAFTWGVLDRLLEDETLNISGISGTSAGALNAAVLATGWARAEPGQERTSAREALAAFWHAVGGSGNCFGGPGPLAVANAAMSGFMPSLSNFNLDWNPGYVWLNQFLRLFSPYQFNAFGDNPMRRVLVEHVDIAAVRKGKVPIFVTATSVRTGQPRIFDKRDLSIDALLASACLPQLFKAVPIAVRTAHGSRIEHYWDGGYSGNPALWPLIYDTACRDLLLVRINPLVRDDVPDTPSEIADRINEIGFNTALFGELRAIAFVQKLVREGHIDGRSYKDLRVHTVSDDHALSALSQSSKWNTDARFLAALHELGRGAAERWMRAHRRDIGVSRGVDIHKVFLDAHPTEKPEQPGEPLEGLA